MPHDPIGGDPGHERVGVMNALSAAKPEGERDGVGKVARIRYFRSLSWSPPGTCSYFLSMTK
jgi:hypothetical protein